MTSKEKIIDQLLAHCDKQIRSHNLRTFYIANRSIKLDPTRILEDWEKDANLPLPEKLYLPKESCELQIDKNGIKTNGELIKWSQIKLTAIAFHHINSGRHENYIENYFMAYISKEKIINIELGDISEYSNLLGHFIESYKPKTIK